MYIFLDPFYIIGKKTMIELSPLGWAAVCLAVIVFDLLSFIRRMNEYVRIKLMEEEREQDPDPVIPQ